MSAAAVGATAEGTEDSIEALGFNPYNGIENSYNITDDYANIFAGKYGKYNFTQPKDADGYGFKHRDGPNPWDGQDTMLNPDWCACASAHLPH